MKSFASQAESPNWLDIAIMNAGLASLQWNLTADGWERQIQVNVLSTTFLSLLLLPQLEQPSESASHALPQLDLWEVTLAWTPNLSSEVPRTSLQSSTIRTLRKN